MKLYLDTSALVKLYVEEEGSPVVRSAVEQASFVATSALAYVEARAAFVRRSYEKEISAAAYRTIKQDLDADWHHYLVVEITNSLILESARLAEVHRLRAYDAVHLAAAKTVCGKLQDTFIFGCWDHRLEKAAIKEGLVPLRISKPVTGSEE